MAEAVDGEEEAKSRGAAGGEVLTGGASARLPSSSSSGPGDSIGGAAAAVAAASSMSESMIALALRRKFANTLRQSLLPNRRSPYLSLSLFHSFPAPNPPSSPCSNSCLSFLRLCDMSVDCDSI